MIFLYICRRVPWNMTFYLLKFPAELRPRKELKERTILSLVCTLEA